MDLTKFTLREDELMDRLKAAIGRSGRSRRDRTSITCQEVLGERLWYWQFWVGDSAIYLNELRNLVEDMERKHPEGLRPDEHVVMQMAQAYGEPLIAHTLAASEPKQLRFGVREPGKRVWEAITGNLYALHEIRGPDQHEHTVCLAEIENGKVPTVHNLVGALTETDLNGLLALLGPKS